MSPEPTVVISGRLAAVPGQGGATWAVLQYVLGFERLGWRVLLIEPLDRPLAAAVAAYFDGVVDVFGLWGRASLLPPGGDPSGVGGDDLRAALRNADLLIDISGTARHRWDLVASIPRRVYLDLDPGFTQIWHAQGIDVGIRDHTHFVTVGTGLGSGTVPDCGVEWIPTLPPVVLERWPPGTEVAYDGFTTVANWRSYGPVEHEGRTYGQKAHSIRPFAALPGAASQELFLALAIDEDEGPDLAALAGGGWTLLDPTEVAGTPAAYRAFVRGSRAELGFAKSGYVEARCGWFSDRSACYLAAGRPVLAQDTGFGGWLPVGEGLLAFSTMDEALAGIEAIVSDYARHRAAARRVAETHLDSNRVLARLTSAVGVPAAA